MYDELYVEEITESLARYSNESDKERFRSVGLIVAADVFVYSGEPEGVFASASKSLLLHALLLLYYCFTTALLLRLQVSWRECSQALPSRSGREVGSQLYYCFTTASAALILLYYCFTTALLLQVLPSRSGREVGSLCHLNGPHTTKCPHTTRFPHTTMCLHTTVYVSSYYCVFVLILLYMCPHTAMYVYVGSR